MYGALARTHAFWSCFNAGDISSKVDVRAQHASMQYSGNSAIAPLV